MTSTGLQASVMQAEPKGSSSIGKQGPTAGSVPAQPPTSQVKDQPAGQANQHLGKPSEPATPQNNQVSQPASQKPVSDGGKLDVKN